MNTGKYPRTLTEAFGPYTTANFDEPSRRPAWVFAVAIAVLIVVLSI